MNQKRLLMISTDRLIFDEKSEVRARQIEYAKNWDEVHIVVFNRYPRGVSDANLKISPNCWIYSTESYSKFLYPFDAIKLGRQIITEHKISEITCQDSSLTAMVGVSLKKKFNIPLEIQIHTDIGSPYFARTITNKIRLMMAKKYLLEADKIRVVSERIKKYVEVILSNKDCCGDCRCETGNSCKCCGDNCACDKTLIEVRPIVVDTEFIKNAPITVDLHKKYPQFTKIVLMASRLEKEKNIELAIRSWSEIIKINPTVGLIIVGSGSEGSKLKTLISKLGLNKNIFMEKWVDKNILASYYKTADLFLVTSLFEGYGMTLVEANAVGCKIVSTDVGIAKEMNATIVGYNTKEVADVIVSKIR